MTYPNQNGTSWNTKLADRDGGVDDDRPGNNNWKCVCVWDGTKLNKPDSSRRSQIKKKVGNKRSKNSPLFTDLYSFKLVWNDWQAIRHVRKHLWDTHNNNKKFKQQNHSFNNVQSLPTSKQKALVCVCVPRICMYKIKSKFNRTKQMVKNGKHTELIGWWIVDLDLKSQEWKPQTEINKKINVED